MEASILDKVVQQISSTKKYSDLYLPTIKHIVESTAQKFVKEKDILARSKNLLHRMWGAYYTSFPDFKKLSQKYQRKEVTIDQILKIHFSTLERSSISNEFYSELFANKKSISVADFGCGLHPLMILSSSILNNIAKYDAFDIHKGEIAFLNSVFELHASQKFTAHEGDLILGVPTEKYDVALLLNLVPVLEMIEKDCTQRILSSINAEEIVVSFPTSTLKTRKNYLGGHHEIEFSTKLREWGLPFIVKNYATEVVFVITKLT